MKTGESRQYIVPLRREFLKTPKWRRTKKAMSALRSFIVKHTKTEDIRISRWVNEAMWARSGKRPPSKIAVKVEKKTEGEKDKKRTFIDVELAELPPRAKRIQAQEEKKKKDEEKKSLLKKKDKEVEEEGKPERVEKKVEKKKVAKKRAGKDKRESRKEILKELEEAKKQEEKNLAERSSAEHLAKAKRKTDKITKRQELVMH